MFAALIECTLADIYIAYTDSNEEGSETSSLDLFWNLIMALSHPLLPVKQEPPLSATQSVL